MNSQRSFLAAFLECDAAAAAEVLARTPGLLAHDSYQAHPLLRSCVEQNDGHCYRKAHLQIADMLVRREVREFRDALLGDRLSDVRARIDADPALVFAEFTAGRGIAQPIHHWRSTAVAQLLLDSGADIDAQTSVHSNGDTPLCLKLRDGDTAAIRFLLKRGADPNRGPLKFMPSPAMPEAVALLVTHGWNINEGAGARTLLHHDAHHGHGAKVRILLEFGADPNVRDAAGRTPLHLLAARGAGRDAIQALARAGAIVDVRDAAGHAPLDLARQAKRRTAERELVALGAG